MKAIQKVKGKRLKILQQKEITEQVLHVSKAFSSKCGSETKKGVMKVILVMLWSLKKKMIGCGAWECSSTACVDAVFSQRVQFSRNRGGISVNNSYFNVR